MNAMLESLQNLDAQLLVAINGANSQFMDYFMWFVSGKLEWLPMILGIVFFLIKRDWKSGLTIIIAIALTILLADQISSGVLKPLVHRPRPTHESTLESLLHIVRGYRGGPFGFPSSHAANSFGVVILLSMLLRTRIFTVIGIFWAILVCYSRMYLGVHYPGDILCGAIIGIAAGLFVYWLMMYLQQHNKQFAQLDFTISNNYKVGIISSVIMNLFFVILLTIFVYISI